MRRDGFIILLFILLMVFIFPSMLIGVELKPPPAKAVPSTTPKPIEKPLPDLMVEKIWLDAQCQINFQLKNIGRGDIIDGDHSASAVKVQYGAEVKEFFLGKVDPGGVLKKAGGFVSFDTEIKLTSPVDVKVIVDFNQKIKEPDPGEKNNEKMAKLIPQCPTVAKLPQEMVRAEIKPLPFDLAIDRVYLNDLTCKIHVVLRNLGIEKIPDEVYKMGRLRIISEHYKNVPTLPLSQVDPAKELNGGRKLKDFGTNLILHSKERVTFRFENVNDGHHTNDSKTADLTPSSRCSQLKTGVPTVVMMKPLPKLELIKESPSPEIMRRTPPITRPSSPIEESAPSKRGISAGLPGSPSISVTSPSKGEILELGSNFTIKWKLPEGAHPWVGIDLFLPGTQLTPSNFQKTWSYLVETTPNDGIYDWEYISFSTPYQGPLQIRIRTIDGKAYGDSEIFSIGPPKGEK